MVRNYMKHNTLARHVLVGAAIGLYFGLFFRPVRTPNILFTLQLAFIVTVVLVCIEAIRKRPPVLALFKSALGTFVKTTALLLVLDLRHVAFAYGGKVAVTIFTTAAGALAGLYYAYAQSRERDRREKD